MRRKANRLLNLTGSFASIISLWQDNAEDLKKWITAIAVIWTSLNAGTFAFFDVIKDGVIQNRNILIAILSGTAVIAAAVVLIRLYYLRKAKKCGLDLDSIKFGSPDGTYDIKYNHDWLVAVAVKRHIKPLTHRDNKKTVVTGRFGTGKSVTLFLVRNELRTATDPENHVVYIRVHEAKKVFEILRTTCNRCHIGHDSLKLIWRSAILHAIKRNHTGDQRYQQFVTRIEQVVPEIGEYLSSNKPLDVPMAPPPGFDPDEDALRRNHESILRYLEIVDEDVQNAVTEVGKPVWIIIDGLDKSWYTSNATATEYDGLLPVTLHEALQDLKDEFAGCRFHHLMAIRKEIPAFLIRPEHRLATTDVLDLDPISSSDEFLQAMIGKRLGGNFNQKWPKLVDARLEWAYLRRLTMARPRFLIHVLSHGHKATGKAGKITEWHLRTAKDELKRETEGHIRTLVPKTIVISVSKDRATTMLTALATDDDTARHRLLEKENIHLLVRLFWAGYIGITKSGKSPEYVFDRKESPGPEAIANLITADDPSVVVHPLFRRR